jgi:peptidoglycan/xylan/chitin deacetylase (PgdA/CDA1 family)
MYHRILGEDRTFPGLPVRLFSEQMHWLREHCEPISPASLVERAGQGRRMRPAALVTFDDGYRDYHELAYPILRDLGIPAIVFLATSLIDEGRMLWTEELQWAVLASTRQRVSCPWTDEAVVTLSDVASRRAWGRVARKYLKALPDEARRAALEKMHAELGRPPPLERQMLSWDEVRATRDITTYGGHTHTHPILSRVERTRAETEIETCRDRILSETGCAPTCFAYPSGNPADFTAETQAILREHGFTLAFSTIEGIAGPDSDWMAVKRLPTDAASTPDFVWVAAGLYPFGLPRVVFYENPPRWIRDIW